jgi:hypothetical protein
LSSSVFFIGSIERNLFDFNFAEREVDTHILNIKAQLLQAKRNAFFQEWVKTLRTKETYIDIVYDLKRGADK